MTFLKIEDRVRCPNMRQISKTRRDIFCTSGSMLRGITEEVKKQAEQRMNSRFIMYVTKFHLSALQNNLRKITTTQEGKRLSGFRKEPQLPNDRGALLRARAVPMRMHEQGYTPSDMEDFDRTAHEKRIYVASSTELAFHLVQNKVVQPYQGGGSDDVKTELAPGNTSVVWSCVRNNFCPLSFW